jgi:spore maturation protein CgeB
VRFLFIDANYPAFLSEVYRSHRGLHREPYARQVATIHEGLFGEAPFQAAALRALGHEAEVVVTNAHDAQAAWAKEHAVQTRTYRGDLSVRLRQGLVPWLERKPRETNWEIVFQQVRSYGPDVLYVEIMDSIPAPVVRELTSLVRISIAQIAAPIPANAYLGYDLILSSIPTFVEDLRRQGATAAPLPLAFEPSVLDAVPAGDRDIAVSFVGSVGPSHPERSEVLAKIASSVGLDVFTQDPGPLRELDGVSVHRPTFGRDMYAVLRRSRITINAHAPWAGPDANNLRMYEATGMAALLLTDARRNLGDLFEIGSEVVAYQSPREAAEIAATLLGRTDEIKGIADAGQRRTLREHTWSDRMLLVSQLVERLPALSG